MNPKEAIEYIHQYAETTFDLWDQDQDHKVGKRLRALAGRTGYDHQLDTAFSVLKQGVKNEA